MTCIETVSLMPSPVKMALRTVCKLTIIMTFEILAVRLPFPGYYVLATGSVECQGS